MTDPVGLTAMLVRCPSVTPEEGGALVLLRELLEPAGFACTRIDRDGVPNLYARFGRGAPVFAFAGHTDVVPVGDPADWSADPFGAEERDGWMLGRGSVDMKSGVAAFVSASLRVADWLDPERGSIALLITGDEEGPSLDGTRAILDWMEEHGERADVCVVGEPSAAGRVGDRVRIGRRGSANGVVTITGRQGHTAYPEQAENPLPALARLATRLAGETLDTGTAHFQPSTLALTSIDVGNTATNVIPRRGRLAFNVRFNDTHTGESLRAWAERLLAEATADSGLATTLDWTVSGEAFVTDPEGAVEPILATVAAETGARPELSTGGGTSDARLIKTHCPVVEVGLVGQGMHAVDEAVPIADIRTLADLYEAILRRYFDG
ncbi:MAG: succinyl-diaminopimelate desuccinylase [Paracoccaceae bacterium]